MKSIHIHTWLMNEASRKMEIGKECREEKRKK